MNNKLTLVTGGMFSGKTTELIRLLERETFAKKKVEVYKPINDNRYSLDCISSHNKLTYPSKNLPLDLSGVLPSLKSAVSDSDSHVFAFDEIQFYSIDFIELIYHTLATKDNVKVILAGLNLDAWQRPFGTVPYFSCISDEVIRLKAICHRCGQDALFSQYLLDGKEVSAPPNNNHLVGGAESYEARCRDCFVLDS